MNIQKLSKIAFFLTFTLLLLTACNLPTTASLPSGKELPDTDIQNAVESAFLEQKEDVKAEEIVFTLFDIEVDHLQFSQDQKTALVWFAMLDKTTGKVEGTEPGFAIATQVSTPANLPESWKMTFQHQDTWSSAIWQLSDELLSPEDKQMYSGKAQAVPHDSQIFTGYKLPWPQGEAVKLSGSIAHVFIYKTCPNTCLYAFDFWNGEMFPISAAKAGTVKTAVWEYANGNTTNTNYILIEDTTTNPTTYQIYYHLAQDSIPEALRIPGAPVYQGQFIGNADDTGASTAHHLHFMVHTNPSSYWGSSVDIVFDEVAVNGGRPRTCVEATTYPEYGSECISGDWYISQNAEELPPTIQITSPTSNQVINTATVDLTAEADDDNGIQSIEAFARQDGEGWLSLGTTSNSTTFSLQINLCELNLTATTIEIAFEVTDLSGKTTSTKDDPITILNQFACEETPQEPQCEPEEDQITIYSEPNYEGLCTILSAGNYYGLNESYNVGNDQTSSIQVGNAVYSVVYTDTNLKGFQETFTTSEPDLSDNPIGENTISSILVSTYPAIPSAPTLPNSFTYTEEDRLGIAWNGDGESYYASLSLNGTIIRTLDWTAETYWELGALDAGEYEMSVTAKNISGTASSSFTFTIIPVEQPLPHTIITPLTAITTSTQINLNWEVTTGEDNIQSFIIQYRINEEGDWLLLTILDDPDQRQFITYGQPGDTYEFRVRAIADNGETEEWSSDSETRTTIETSCIPDSYESNNDTLSEFETAASYTIGEPQTHNFCDIGDIDWVVFTPESTGKFSLELSQNESQSPIAITLLDQSGNTEDETVTLKEGDEITLRLIKGSIYYMKFEPENTLLSGSDTNYEFTLKHTQTLFWYGFYLFIISLAGSFIKYFSDRIQSKKKS